MEKITSEIVNGYHTQYMFLTNAIPDLKKQYDNLEAQIIQAKHDLDTITATRTEALDLKEAAINKKDRELDFREQMLNVKESEINKKVEEDIKLKKYIEKSQANLQSMLDQDTLKKISLDELNRVLTDSQNQLDKLREELESNKVKFQVHIAATQTDLNRQQRELDSQKSVLNSERLKCADLSNGLSKKLVEVNEVKFKTENTLILAEERLNAAKFELENIHKRGAALTQAELELKEKQDFINSKELDLKALKVQLDRRETKLKELIINSGLQISEFKL